MKSRIVSVILSVCLLCQISFAEYCAFLADVKCGETTTLALDDSNNLWSCGSSNIYALGLGDIQGEVLSLQRVKGINGNGYLNNIISFDAGWYHSLAVTSDGLCLAWGSNDNSYGLLGK